MGNKTVFALKKLFLAGSACKGKDGDLFLTPLSPDQTQLRSGSGAGYYGAIPEDKVSKTSCAMAANIGEVQGHGDSIYRISGQPLRSEVLSF